MSPIKRGRRGKTGEDKDKQRSSFKWSEDLQMSMAEYLRSNYEIYKESLSQGRKISFLRGMRHILEINCNDLQLKNGFMNFMKKYEDVKHKLNSSGFGIDPEKDKTLDKGWILKKCPYFEILDEVLSCRPNVTPPSMICTSQLASVRQNNEDMNLSSEEDAATVAETSVQEPDGDGNQMDGETPQSTGNETDADPEVKQFVKKAFEGLKGSKDSLNSKSALGIFSKIMTEKLEVTSRLEEKKIKLDENRYTAEVEMHKERNRIELLKANTTIELEKQKIDLELQKIADRKAKREHELRMMQLQQEFELKKLELQNKKE